MQVHSTVGIDNLKLFVVRAVQATDLDKNRDGNISPAEIAIALSGLAGSVFSISSIIKEARDLQPDEIAELLETVKAYLPDYVGVDDKIENLVRAILAFLAAMTVSFVAVLDAVRILKDPKAVVPVAAKSLVSDEGLESASETEPQLVDDSTQSKGKVGRPRKRRELWHGFRRYIVKNIP